MPIPPSLHPAAARRGLRHARRKRRAGGLGGVERLEPRTLLAAFVPNDPLFFPGTDAGAALGYYGQWHLDNRLPIVPGLNAGLDAGLAGAWDRGLTGSGVTIAILDDGVQGDHPDLAAGFRNALSWDFGATAARNRASAVRGAPVRNAVGIDGDSHGTAVAGVAAARGGNGLGTTGAAPAADIAALRVLAPRIARGHSPDQAEAAAIRYQGQSNAAGRPDPFAPVNWSAGVPVRVKNHSYGPDWPYLASAHGTVSAALAESAAHGVIHVVAAGNQRGAYPTADANKIQLAADPNVITVAALGSDGRLADYSSFGANVFVTAPSSSAWQYGIATTDRTTFDHGYTFDPDDPDPFLADVADGAATSTFGGTSASAPLVAGIMALGVEANPALDVRMARHLLARTSRVVDAGNPSWVTNAAGFSFSDDYGFGLIDADAFTQLATEVTNVTPVETVRSPTIAVGTRFAPTRPVVTATHTLPGDAATVPLEAVRVTLDVTNLQTDLRAYRHGSGRGRGAISGDLAATLTSPSGTRARLFSDDRFLMGTDAQKHRYGEAGARPRPALSWTFTSNAYWGESAAGTWTLEVSNQAAPAQLTRRGGTVRSVAFQFDTGAIAFGASSGEDTARTPAGRGYDTPTGAGPRTASPWLAALGLAWGVPDAAAAATATAGRRVRPVPG